MKPLRVQRYIFREIAVPMGLGLFVFTFVLLMGRSQKLLEMVINKGVPFFEMVRLFLTLLPAFLVLTVPVAFLLGVLLGFGRLSAESELIAFKSCGISLPVMMKPVLGLALCASLAVALLTLLVEPRANAAFRRQALQMVEDRASLGIRPQVFNDDFSGLVLYASAVDDESGRMTGVFIADERTGTIPATVFAEQGEIRTSPGEHVLFLQLRNGSIHRREGGEDDVYQVIGFSSYVLRIDLDQEGGGGKAFAVRRESEMTLGELQEARRAAGESKEGRALAAAFHKRFVLATTPLLFALVGAPLGIRSHRSGRGIGFAVALGIFLLFYVMTALAKTLVVQLGLPVLLVWLPVAVFLGLGVMLLRFAAREEELSWRLLLPFRRNNPS